MGYLSVQSDRREITTTVVLKDIRFKSDWNVYDKSSRGKTNKSSFTPRAHLYIFISPPPQLLVGYTSFVFWLVQVPSTMLKLQRLRVPSPLGGVNTVSSQSFLLISPCISEWSAPSSLFSNDTLPLLSTCSLYFTSVLHPQTSPWTVRPFICFLLIPSKHFRLRYPTKLKLNSSPPCS